MFVLRLINLTNVDLMLASMTVCGIYVREMKMRDKLGWMPLICIGYTGHMCIVSIIFHVLMLHSSQSICIELSFIAVLIMCLHETLSITSVDSKQSLVMAAKVACGDMDLCIR